MYDRSCLVRTIQTWLSFSEIPSLAPTSSSPVAGLFRQSCREKKLIALSGYEKTTSAAMKASLSSIDADAARFKPGQAQLSLIRVRDVGSPFEAIVVLPDL